MENAVKALEMAFAVMVFVIALSVSMISFNKAKQTSDAVLYTKDETNYYKYEGATGKAAENRIVGLESIIPTLYKYYKENYTVVFRQAKYYEQKGEFISEIEPLEIYKTSSRYKAGTSKISYLWGTKVLDKEYTTYDVNMYKKYNKYINSTNVMPSIFSKVYNSIGEKRGNTSIFSFDLEEETLRHEPWTGRYDETEKNLECFLNGGIYNNPNTNTEYIKYNEGFIDRFNTNKFVETIAEYEYSSSQSASTEDGSTIGSLVKAKKKRMIIYTLIK